MSSKKIFILITLLVITLIWFYSKRDSSRLSKSIDLKYWNEVSIRSIKDHCDIKGLDSMVYPLNSLNFIISNNLRDSLIKELDAVVEFKRNWSELNILEKNDKGSSYRVYVWFDSDAPVYYLNYYFGKSNFDIEILDREKIVTSNYQDLLTKAEIYQYNCYVDRSMNVLNGTSIYSRFEVRKDKLLPKIYEVSLY